MGKELIQKIRHELRIARRLNNQWRNGVLTACLHNIGLYVDEIEKEVG